MMILGLFTKYEALQREFRLSKKGLPVMKILNKCSEYHILRQQVSIYNYGRENERSDGTPKQRY